jgi:phage tail-like protein
MPDVNGSRHHLILGQDDWALCSTPDKQQPWLYSPASNAVTLNALPFLFPQPAGDRVLNVCDRRGATRDSYGHWYWIGKDRRSIMVRWHGARAATHYWPDAGQPRCAGATPSQPFRARRPPAQPAPERLAGLAATTGHYLVAGSPDTGRLLVFDLHAGGAPIRVKLPETPGGRLSRPFDLAPLPGGGLVVLDRCRKLLWVLDAAFRPVPLPELAPSARLLFQPVDGDPRRSRARRHEARGLCLRDCANPVSVEPLPDGTFLILDSAGADPSTVRRYRWGQSNAIASVPLKEPALVQPGEPPLSDLAQGTFAIVGHDIAFIPGGDAQQPGTLFIVSAGGNQAFALQVRLEQGLELRVLRSFFPLRSYTGRALVKPLTPSGERLVYFDQSDRWVPVMELPRARYTGSAQLDLPVFDGQEPGCVWHRLCLDACIPAETEVRVLAWAADEVESLEWLQRQAAPERQPPPYRRGAGAEIPYYSLWSQDELGHPQTGTWELLFQGLRGRYVRIRLELAGNGRVTPLIRALRAHYPRFSYLKQYLPGVYQRDPGSADFVERFLANPEGMFTTLEGMIAGAQHFFDPRTVPADALDWLAGWMGLALDPGWSEYQRRLLIAHAPDFFRRRGTVPGIIQAIRLVIRPQDGPAIFQDTQHDESVRIIEGYRTRTVPASALGDPTSPQPAAAGAEAHRFSIMLPATTSVEQIALVEQIVRLEKPAHTDFVIKQYWAMFRVGEVRLGLDTTLGEGGRFELFRLGQTGLAEGILSAAYPFDLTNRTVLAD